MCVSKSADIQELKQRIYDALSRITAEMRKNVMLEYKECLHEFLENGGSHIKVYSVVMRLIVNKHRSFLCQ